jgi:CRISPR system Cascade subunit CasB
MTRAVTTPSAEQPENSRYRWADEFVAYIRQLLSESSKARADLRSGLGRPMEQCARLDGYLAYRLSETMSSDAQRARYAVASLIAAQPAEHHTQRDVPDPAEPAEGWWQRPNLGASLALAVGHEVLKPGSAEDDLQLMTRQSAEALQQRLPALTRRLRAAGIPIDWAVLLVDLGRWNRSRDQIVTAWQEQYYRARARALVEDGSANAAERGPDTFVDHVLDLCEDNAAQADLRTGLGREYERCHRMHPHLVRHLPQRMRHEDRRAHYTVAALIAVRLPRSVRDADEPDPAAASATGDGNSTPAAVWWRRPNLGAALAQAVNKKVFKPESAEDDLQLMTRQSAAALRHQQLPALVRRLRAAGIPIDWAVLIEDLARWDRDRDAVAARWLDSYFHVRTLEDRMNTEEEN